ncbi:MAG: hypothetical protein WCN98_03630, partial [Verrucomicrobiaceae bacterium]
LGLTGTGYDPAMRLRGWSEAGAQAGAFLAKTPQPEKTFVVVLGDRSNASQLAFYMPQHPRVFRFVYQDVIESQYELWPDPGDCNYFNNDALIFMPPDDSSAPPQRLPMPLERQFRSVDELGSVVAPLGHGAARTYNVYLARRLKFWVPPPRDPVAPPEADKPADKPDGATPK